MKCWVLDQKADLKIESAPLKMIDLPVPVAHSGELLRGIVQQHEGSREDIQIGDRGMAVAMDPMPVGNAFIVKGAKTCVFLGGGGMGPEGEGGGGEGGGGGRKGRGRGTRGGVEGELQFYF